MLVMLTMLLFKPKTTILKTHFKFLREHMASAEATRVYRLQTEWLYFTLATLYQRSV